MVNIRQQHYELSSYLQARGRKITSDGTILRAPRWEYSTVEEEILNLLNLSALPLTITQLANYLGMRTGRINKAIRKLGKSYTAKKMVRIIRNQEGVASYTFDLPKESTIKSFYDLVKSEKKEELSEEPPMNNAKSEAEKVYIIINSLPIDFVFTRDILNTKLQELYGTKITSTISQYIYNLVKYGFILSERIGKGPKKQFTVKRHIEPHQTIYISSSRFEDITSRPLPAKPVHTKPDDEVTPPKGIIKITDYNEMVKLLNYQKELIISLRAAIHSKDTDLLNKEQEVKELKSEIAELLDENANLTTDNKRLNQSQVATLNEISTDLDEFYINLKE